MKKSKYKHRYLVAYKKMATRDIQVTNEPDTCLSCDGEPCLKGECPTPLRKWKDFNGQVILGFYRGNTMDEAIAKAAIAEICHVSNLVAYKLK
jgi:hypothetical protein